MIFDKVDREMRQATEFILRVKQVYTLSDIRKFDFLTYFKILEEAEIQEQEAIERMKQANEV